MTMTETDSLDRLLLRRWELDPSLTAVVDGDETVTTGELRRRVLWVAGELRARGIGPGDRVAVYHERSLRFVVSVLAVVVAGAAHVAFDVNDPLERTRQMIADSCPSLLLTGSASAARLAAPVPTLIVTGHEESAFEPPRSAAALADEPAVVLYTSGSTGRPKASLISHRALVSRLTALQRSHPLDQTDRMIHHTACTFDMFLIEIYWPLLAGATVVLAEPGRQRDSAHLAELIRRHAITTFYCVVSLLDLFLLTRDEAERYDGLRRVLTGGEPLSPELVRRFYARSTAPLTNLYGPSECTIYCTAWTCPRDPLPDTVLIGSAIEDTTLWILDDAGNPVPDGDPGELSVGGAGLALGYLDRPELTADRFVDDPVRGRRYRTGDLVRASATGDLEFLGRTDQQVKIRGIRVELGEIEATALRCAGVRQAAVVAQGDGRDKRLVAFLGAEDGTEADEIASAVRERLRACLPAYLVPAVFQVIDDFPLTANGKLDRTALAARAPAPTPAVAARTVSTVDEMEDLVADVWRSVLAAAEIRRDADFFDIGGNSFAAARVVRTMQDLLAVPVPLEALLREPTVETFSAGLLRLTTRERTP
jgi:amino acid adenylation domain-containing protein